MSKIGIAVNLKDGSYFKRLWFEVKNEGDSISRFDLICKKIDSLDVTMDWIQFLRVVEEMFSEHGFLRIAK